MFVKLKEVIEIKQTKNKTQEILFVERFKYTELNKKCPYLYNGEINP